MTLHQCKAIVLHGRDRVGNRGGLVPPRRCRRPSRAGDYCGLHDRQAELQDLLRNCMGHGWEHKVHAWEARRQREAEAEGRQVVRVLHSIASRSKLTAAADFLRDRSGDLARTWSA